MFRRKSSSTAPSAGATAVSDSSSSAPKPGGKGRPTPTRKEAEAARRAAAKAPRSRKEAAAQQRLKRAETSRKMREAMKTGDERYLPSRDRGPVKRFVRDYVDSHFTIAELIIPVLIVTMILGWSGNARLAWFGNTFMTLVLLAVAVNLVLLRWTMRKQIRTRFGPESLRGTTSYALFRALQLRPLRLPKPQVKIGQELPQSYR